MVNEKYIKLSDAKDEFYYVLSDHDTAIVDCKDADAILDGVDAADVAPVVHGKWISQIYAKYECSKCGFYETDKDYSYCPNCGAKMDL